MMDASGRVFHSLDEDDPYNSQYLELKREHTATYHRQIEQALAGRRFVTWDALNAWLEEWCLTIADQRLHGTTHERPIDRFAQEQPALVATGSQPSRTPKTKIRFSPSQNVGIDWPSSAMTVET